MVESGPLSKMLEVDIKSLQPSLLMLLLLLPELEWIIKIQFGGHGFLFNCNY